MTDHDNGALTHDEGDSEASPYAQMDDDLAAVDRHVRHGPMVIPVHFRRRRPAHRTWHGYIPSPGRDHHCVAAVRHVLDHQTESPENTIHTRELISITRS